MTTFTPTAKITIPLHFTLTSPFHHGAGTQGNTSVLRTQDVMQPDGTVSRVPFLSAASIRHQIRDIFAWHLATTLEIEPGTLSKQAVDLIWSGGAVTSTGARTDLDMMRKVEEYLPALAMLGYAAKSDIIEGTLRASDLILVCRENNFRSPMQSDKRAAAYRSEEFGTRRDMTSTPVAAFLDIAAGDIHTMQMIYDTQVLITGSQLTGTLTLTPSATQPQINALHAILSMWTQNGDINLGAKTAQGYGRARAHIDLPENHQQIAEEYTQSIIDHKTEIMDLLGELAK